MINKYCRDYALSHGHLNFKKGKRRDAITGDIIDTDVIDIDNPYTSNDPEERRIIIIDNASNLSTENGLKKMEIIDNKKHKIFITAIDFVQWLNTWREKNELKLEFVLFLMLICSHKGYV